jgi:hypothetical protein
VWHLLKLLVSQDALAPFVKLAMQIGDLKNKIGTETPTVIT